MDGAMLPISAVDQALLDYQEAHPVMPVNVCTLLLGEGSSPNLEELRGFVAERIEVFPDLLRQRIVRLPGRRARWGWFVDRDLDVADLVRERLLPPGSGRAGVRTALGDLVGSPVPVSAPPWQLWLLRGQDDDGFALLYRASHLHQDGAAKNLLISALFGADSARLRGPVQARSRQEGRPGPRALGAAILRSRRWLVPTPAPAAFAGSPGGMTHSWVSTPLQRLRAIGAACGATVNDVFLAALTGALHAGLANDGGPASDVGATMAVSTRRPAEQGLLGNYVAGAHIVLPCSTADPADRLAAVRARTARLKRGGHLGIGERLLFDALPARLRQQVLTKGLDSRSAALSLSNVFTPSGPLEVAGRPLHRAVPIPSLFAGQRLAIHLGGVDNVVSVGAAISDAVRGLADLTQQWLAELRVLEVALGLPAGEAGRLSIPARRSAADIPASRDRSAGGGLSHGALVQAGPGLVQPDHLDIDTAAAAFRRDRVDDDHRDHGLAAQGRSVRRLRLTQDHCDSARSIPVE